MFENDVASLPPMTTPAVGFTGQFILPGDADYDSARAVFNGMIDNHPYLIARCATVADVAQALRFARDADLEIAVRGGAHSVAGHSTSDGGVVIDLSLMREVTVDVASQTVTVAAGALWQDFDLVAGRHGLATPGGVISTTGCSGFTLGGGVGWLSRKYGMTCDNLIGAELVTLDDGVLTVSETENSDVLWALRGGGGNFGVVTELTFRAHPVGHVTGGLVSYPFEHATDVVTHYAHEMVAAPDDLSAILDFAPASDAPENIVVSILSCDLDTGESGADRTRRLLAPPRADLEPRGSTVVRRFSYPVWQQMLDHTAPHGRHNYWKTAFIDDLTPAAIAVLCQIGGSLPSPQARLHLIRMGGVASRTGAEHAAFTARHHTYVVHLITAWEDPAMTERCVSWTRAAHALLDPFAAPGAYLNFIGDEGQERIREAFGADAYSRLARLKARLDPDNVLRKNQNIEPASAV